MHVVQSAQQDDGRVANLLVLPLCPACFCPCRQVRVVERECEQQLVAPGHADIEDWSDAVMRRQRRASNNLPSRGIGGQGFPGHFSAL
eukprot:6408600-Lingulodinium_polyedra.AAC.1